jgi:hypothetical protein
VHNISDITQTEVQRAEPLVLCPSDLEVVIKFWLKKFKHEVKYYCLLSTNSLILFEIKGKCVISARSLLFYQFAKRVIELTVIIIMVYNHYQCHKKLYCIFFSQC